MQLVLLYRRYVLIYVNCTQIYCASALYILDCIFPGCWLVGVDACVAFQVVCKAGRSSAPETIHQSNCRATNQSHSGQQYWSRERWSKIGSRDRVLSATNTATWDNMDKMENTENLDNI